MRGALGCIVPSCREAVLGRLLMLVEQMEVKVPLCGRHLRALDVPMVVSSSGEYRWPSQLASFDDTDARPGETAMAPKPEPLPPWLGANVMYRSRTGDYWLAGVIARTCRSSSPEALHRAAEHGRLFMVPLSLYEVDLTVFTPGGSFIEGQPSQWTGTYAEHQVKYDPDGAPGTWCWDLDLTERGVRL